MTDLSASPLGALTRRPIQPEDADFLLRLYAGTRAEELAVLAWPDAQKAAFLHQQFHAQHTYYHAQYPNAAFHLLLRGQVPIGRLYVDRRPDEICILDIALLPEHRGQGLGTALLQELIFESEATRLTLRLHVENYNPACRLYDRLGFVQVSDNGVYTLRERLPTSAAP